VLLVVACSQPGRDAFTPATFNANGFTPDAEHGYANLSGHAASKGTAVIKIVVPPHPASSAKPLAVTPVSPGAQGVDVQVSASGAAVQRAFFALGADRSYCKGGTVTVALTCELTLDVAASNDTFVLNVETTTTAGGPLLAVGRATQAIRAGKTQSVIVPMNGVISFLQIALGNPHPPATGKSANVQVYLTAADAWGYTIVGAYDNPIALTDSDTSGHTSLSTTTVADSASAGKLLLK